MTVIFADACKIGFCTGSVFMGGLLLGSLSEGGLMSEAVFT